MDNSLKIRFAISLLTSFSMAARSFKRKSVDLSAVFVGIPVMVIHMLAGYRFAALLLVFFFTSSKLTRVGEERKRAIDSEFKEGGQRDWKQVLSNSGIATLLVITIASFTGGQDRCLDTMESNLITGLLGGVIGHYACCNGDTWSSELGILSNAQPRLITTFKRVRKGTNGGVTLDGLLAAAAAGFIIGLTFVLIGFLTSECSPDVAWRQLLVIPIATAAGVCGSLIDSLLGATVQYSGYCNLRKKVVGKQGPTVTRISGMDILDNNGVNVVAVLITTILTSTMCLYIF
ncbi:protein PGR-like [Typha latifolia]|uniref:protein PGR-like n=1 Tax=Typha latifolia TaxID=4733 RepID=UPI003C2B1476